MITAFVLLELDVDRVADAAETIAEIPEAVEVYSVTGRYDLIVKVKVTRNEDLADVVTGAIGRVGGVRRSETVIAFRSYADRVLDAGFAFGQDVDA